MYAMPVAHPMAGDVPRSRFQEVDQEAPTTIYVSRPPRAHVTVEAARTQAKSRKSRRWIVDLTMTAVGSLLGVYLGSAAVRAQVIEARHEAAVALHLEVAPETGAAGFTLAAIDLRHGGSSVEVAAVPSAARTVTAPHAQARRVARRASKGHR